MNEGLAGYRDIEQGVALAGDFRHAPADQQDQIGFFGVVQQFGVATQPDVTDKTVVGGGKQHLTAELHSHRQLITLGKPVKRRTSRPDSRSNT